MVGATHVQRWIAELRVAPRLLAFFLVLALALPTLACPFCARMGKTFSDAIDEAEYVVEGELVSASRKGSTLGKSQSHFRPQRIIKAPAPLSLDQPLLLTRYVPTGTTRSNQRILFAEKAGEGFDPYRSMLITSADLGQYLADASAAAQEEPQRRFTFFFQYLEHDDPEIAEDAYKEFAKAPYEEVEAAREGYDPAKLRQWLTDPGVPSYRIGLYGLLLGLSGKGEDAAFLKGLIDQEDDRLLYGIDGIFAGYALLRPQEGAKLVLDVIGDPETPFKRRYAALATVRFLLSDFKEADRATILQRLVDSLSIVDTADLIIDDLRRHAASETFADVFALREDPRYQSSVIQRSILRMALSLDVPPAKAVVQAFERDHPEWIAEENQNLSFERAVEADLSGAKNE